MKSLAIVIVLLTGCASACAGETLTVRVPSPPPSSVQGATAIQVRVNDLRAPGVAASTRQAAFGVPMGDVVFDPPERQLVQDTLEAALNAQPSPTAGATYACDILEFGVNTKTTLFYWDVIGIIRLKLRGPGPEQELYATHTERTYVWPGADLIGKVVQESLRQLVERLQTSP